MAFKESEHPRDANGKFVKGAGSSKDHDPEEIAKEIFPHLREKTRKTSKTTSSKVLTSSLRSGTIVLSSKMMVDINKMITPQERRILDAVPKKAGFFDFAAHGTPDVIDYGSHSVHLKAREVANIIRHSESYHGEKIRLLSCSTGATDNGFAQQLANALGVEVEAPTDILIVYPSGTYKIGLHGEGRMRIFKPSGKEWIK